jgi:putative phosphoesterase
MAYNFNIKIAEQIMIQEIDGLRMLLMHGFGSPEQTKLIAHSFAKSRDYDVVLYGHTHEALVENLNGILVVNPGEAGGILTGKPTAAIMQTKPLSIRIVSLP